MEHALLRATPDVRVEHAVLRATPAVLPVVGLWLFPSPSVEQALFVAQASRPATPEVRVEHAVLRATPDVRVEHAVLRATPAVLPVVGLWTFPSPLVA